MKRLVIEVPYQKYWARFFGRNARHVEVVEALKCFKCDSEGFAVICKVRFLDEKVTIDDLLRDGPVNHAEALYEENDGSVVIFISGSYPKSSRSKGRPVPRGIFVVEPPEFIDVNRMKCVLVGEEGALQEFLRGTGPGDVAPKVLSLTRFGPKSDSVMSMLSAKQRQVLVAAYGLGYYEVPRKVSSEDMARLLKIDKSTLAEHLRKAERKVVKGLLAS
ncbi:MAG: helix-turn-helix domain-containing protein [Thaumarchaeota archaeon]|nr:helix-turn-helix domain-containing protein [Nitrososphaerota archaeon]